MRDFVLLCYTRNTPYSYDEHTPLSILALGTFLERHGVEVEYFDERIDPESRFRELAGAGPRIVGFSVIGGYQIASAARLSRLTRRLSPESLVVWGGISPTILPETTVREDFVDVAVVGEGEETLLELFGALRERAGWDAVPGLVYRKEDDLRRTAPRAPPDVEELPFVYQGKAAGMLRRYLRRGSIREAVGYEVSRGCPFLCSFCYSPNFHSSTRVKSVRKAAEELDALKRLGVSELDIYDDTLFGARKEEFPRYLDLLRERSFRWIGNLRINMLTEDLLRRLEESGCRWIYFGIESNDEAVLAAIRKGFGASDVRRGLDVMRGARIPAVYSVIYGLPLEGEKDKVDRCLDFALELHERHPGAEIQLQSYVPLPGTDLYPRAVAMGFKPPQRLLDWVRHDHFGVTNAWLDEPALAAKLYIATFLAFRYRRHLSRFPFSLAAYPLHRLSLWRVRRKRFGWYFEKRLYDLFLILSELRAALYFFARDRLFSRWKRTQEVLGLRPRPEEPVQ